MTRDLVVVKANSLIEASYRLSIDEVRILALTIGTMNPDSNQKTFDFTVADFVREFPEISIDNAYKQIQGAIKRIYDRSVRTEDDSRVTEFRWVSSRTYFKNEGRFRIAMTDEVMPYLTQLKGQFAQYQLKNIAYFNSVHSIRIYELVTQYRKSGWREITIEDLKKWLQVEENYSRWNNFKARVLDPSVSEINDKSDLLVSYELIKRGRKITGLHFTIKVKKSKLPAPQYAPRPQVKAGTHEEGVYLRDCVARFKTWYRENELTLADVSDDVLKQHYKHVRPLGNELDFEPIKDELERRGIKAIYNSNAAKVEFK